MTEENAASKAKRMTDPEAKHPELELMHRFRYVSGLQDNQGGTRALFVLTEGDKKENSYAQTLWSITPEGPNRLTAIGEEGSFVWDGDDAVLFSAKRTSKEKKRAEEGHVETIYYRLRLDKPGEAQPAFTIPLSVQSLHPLGEGEYLLISDVEPEDGEFWTLSEEKRKEKFDSKKKKEWRTEIKQIPYWLNSRGYLGTGRGRLFHYSENNGDLKVISPVELDLNAVRLTADKDYLYLTGGAWSPKMKLTDGLWRYDTKHQKFECLSEDTGLSIGAVFELADELVLFANGMKKIGINQDLTIWTWNEAEGRAEEQSDVELMAGNSVGTDVSFGGSRILKVSPDHVLFIRTERSRSILKRMNADFTMETVFDRPGSVTGFAELNGDLLISGLQDMRLGEIYLAEGGSSDPGLKQLTQFNDDLFTDVEIITPLKLNADSPAGDGEIDGFVLLPPGFDPAGKRAYPAILDIHGGPKTVYGEVYYHEMQLWAREGYVVMFCNPHGSDGRGDAFSDIRGQYGFIDYDDIMAFVDQVLAAYPAIDAERMGVTGGSYGGFMTNWIVTHSDRFKAAVTQRSISNWTSFYGVSDIGYYFATDQNKTAFTDEQFFETLWKHSPLKYIKEARTPTLVIHADEDYRCPVEQGYQFFTGLQDQGVESKLVVFHGENHELSRGGKPQAREERLAQITDWMNQYLKE